jgi:hypothetical protein
VDDLAQENSAGVFYWPTPALVGDVLYTGLLSETPQGIRIGGGVGIVDVRDPANLVLAGTIPLEGAMIMGLSASEEQLIVFSQQEQAEAAESTVFVTRMQLFDIGNPLAPVEIGRLEPAVAVPEQVWDFAITGTVVYAASVHYGDENEYKLYALDISDPARPAEIGRFELPGNVTKMVPAGDTVYLLLAQGGLWALNVGDPSHPYLSGHLQRTILDFSLDGDWLYLAGGDAGLLIAQVEK